MYVNIYIYPHIFSQLNSRLGFDRIFGYNIFFSKEKPQ